MKISAGPLSFMFVLVTMGVSAAEFEEITEAEARLTLDTSGLELSNVTYRKKVTGFNEFVEFDRWEAPGGQLPMAELILAQLNPGGRKSLQAEEKRQRKTGLLSFSLTQSSKAEVETDDSHPRKACGASIRGSMGAPI